MDGSLSYTESFAASRDPYGHASRGPYVIVSAAITCVCSMCTQHYHALQSKQMGHVMQVTDCVLLALLSVKE
jgi:hypothetical protein